jgi:hypothetical protein
MAKSKKENQTTEEITETITETIIGTIAIAVAIIETIIAEIEPTMSVKKKLIQQNCMVTILTA